MEGCSSPFTREDFIRVAVYLEPPACRWHEREDIPSGPIPVLPDEWEGHGQPTAERWGPQTSRFTKDSSSNREGHKASNRARICCEDGLAGSPTADVLSKHLPGQLGANPHIALQDRTPCFCDKERYTYQHIVCLSTEPNYADRSHERIDARFTGISSGGSCRARFSEYHGCQPSPIYSAEPARLSVAYTRADNGQLCNHSSPRLR